MSEKSERYWMQERAPAGNWVDSLGFGPALSLVEAQRIIEEWARSFPGRRVRLVVRRDEVVMEAEGGAQ